MTSQAFMRYAGDALEKLDQVIRIYVSKILKRQNLSLCVIFTAKVLLYKCRHKMVVKQTDLFITGKQIQSLVATKQRRNKRRQIFDTIGIILQRI